MNNGGHIADTHLSGSVLARVGIVRNKLDTSGCGMARGCCITSMCVCVCVCTCKCLCLVERLSIISTISLSLVQVSLGTLSLSLFGTAGIPIGAGRKLGGEG